MPDFSVRHPEWLEQIHRWCMAWDFYRGGRHVIAPRVQAKSASGFLVNNQSAALTQTISPARAGRMSLPGYTSYPPQSYLHASLRESQEEYDLRVNRAIHIPLFRSIVDIYVSATLRIGADRTQISAGEPWETFWRDVDLCGTNIDAYIRRALTYALVFGKVVSVVDMPRFSDQAPSRLHQVARGERPFSYLLSPAALVDWDLDEHGVFNWAVIEEAAPANRLPGSDHGAPVARYRVWHRDHWTLWEEESDQGSLPTYELIDADEHGLGRVPVEVLYARKSQNQRNTLRADSILDDLIDIDRSLFNQVSLLHDQIYQQCFAQLCLPVNEGEQLPDIQVGTTRYLGFNSANGTPIYLSPNAEVIRVQLEIIERSFALARQVANVSRGRAEFSKEERSAASLNLESQDKHNAVASLAEHVEEFDRNLHSLVALWAGVSEIPDPTYSRELTLKSLGEQIDDAIRLMELNIPQPAMDALKKPILARALKEHGVSESAIREAVAKLEEVSGGSEGNAVPDLRVSEGRNGRAGSDAG